MKKKEFIISLLMGFAFLICAVISCKEEEPVNMAPTLDLNGTGEILRKTAVLNGAIHGNVSNVKSYGFQYSLSDKFPNDQTFSVLVDQKEEVQGSFQLVASGLNPNTRYYFRAFASTGSTEVYSYYDNFTTLSSTSPILEPIEILEVGEDYVSCLCKIIDVGDEYLYEYGVQYRLNDNPEDPFISVKAETKGEDNSYEVKVTGLAAAKKYVFRPYAQNSETQDGSNGFRIGYGDSDDATTEEQQSPVVKTEPVDEKTDVGVTYITVTGNVTSAPGSDDVLDEYGFCYSSTSKNPNLADSKVVVENPQVNKLYNATISGLNPNELYYVRAYAINTVDGESRVGYGDVYQVTTSYFNVPSVSWVSDEGNVKVEATMNTIHAEALITNYEKGILVEKGLIWSKDNYSFDYEEAKKNKTILTIDSDNQNIVGTIDGLELGQRYFVRAYATFKVGSETKTGVSSVIDINTDMFVSSVLSDLTVSDKTYQSANFSCVIASGGNGTIKERGFLLSKYNEVPQPTLESQNITKYVVDGAEFSAKAEGLNYSTRYSLCAYVINEYAGQTKTSYSDVITFTTENLETTVLTEFNVSDITLKSANFSCIIASEGNGTIKEKGFLIAKKNDVSEPTLATENITKLPVDGVAFSAQATDLTYNTEYVWRAYVINEFGTQSKTVYSNVYTFYTPNLATVSLTDLVVSDITFQSAKFSCTIYSEGDGTIKEKGVLVSKYNEVSKPTLNTKNTNKYVVEGAEFSAKAEDLKYYTDYAYRAYVISEYDNELDTVYSYAQSFYTKAIEDATFYGTSIDDNSITYHSLTVSGGINTIGDGSVIERGFIWYDSNSGFEKRDSLAVTSGTVADFSLTIDNLRPYTLYYVRAYAKKKAGNYELVSYDEQTTYDYTKQIVGASLSSVTFVDDSITYRSLKVKSGISSLGDGDLIEKGFYWYPSNSSFEDRDSMAVTSGTMDEFELNIDGLRPYTTYYVRSYAKKKAGDNIMISKSGSYSKSTAKFTLPFSSLVADSIDYSSFIVESGISAISEGTLLEKGFCWKQGDTPTLDDNLGSVKVESDSIQAFSYKIEDLIPGTYYYVRAYAKVKVDGSEYVAYSGYKYVYTPSLDFDKYVTPYDTTCDMKISFTDNEADISAVNVYVTTDYYKSGSYTSNPTLSELTKYTLTKDETTNTFKGTLNQLTASTNYYYHVYYLFNGQEIRLDYGGFSTGRLPNIDDAVSPDKKE